MSFSFFASCSLISQQKNYLGVIPGCGKDLFDESFDDQTRCILSFVNDRQAVFKKHHQRFSN